jgi:glycerol kinase
MSKRAFIGLDQGTRSTKCLLVAESGEVLSTSKRLVGQLDRGQGRVEQDPQQLLESVRETLAEVSAVAVQNNFEISALGLATQRSGVCAWSVDDGVVLHPLITWADTRFEAQIESYADKKSIISEQTLLPVLANYAAPKLSYLQHQFPGSNIAVATLDTFLSWQLDPSRPFITDDTMAARTLLYDIHDRNWSDQLCDIFKVERSRLAQVVPSIAEHGTIQGIRCFARIGDQQAALYALRQYDTELVLNLGSIASITFSVGATARHVKGFPGSVLVSRANDNGTSFDFLLEGISNAAAEVIDSLIERRYINDSSQIDALCAESELNGAQGILLMPCGVSGSPHWRSDLQAADIELTSAADYVRAAIENIAGFIIYQIEHLKAEQLIPSKLTIVVAGGLAQSVYLLQFLSNCLGDEIRLAEIGEATAYGAARAAYDGYMQKLAVRWPIPVRMLIDPQHVTNSRMRYESWREVYERGLRERS